MSAAAGSSLTRGRRRAPGPASGDDAQRAERAVFGAVHLEPGVRRPRAGRRRSPDEISSPGPSTGMPGGYGVTISALTSPAHSASGRATAGANMASRGERTWRVNGGVRARRPEQAAEPPPPAASPYRAARSRSAPTSSSEVLAAVAEGDVEHDVERVGRLDRDAVVVAQHRLELVAAEAEVAGGDGEPRGVELGDAVAARALRRRGSAGRAARRSARAPSPRARWRRARARRRGRPSAGARRRYWRT